MEVPKFGKLMGRPDLDLPQSPPYFRKSNGPPLPFSRPLSPIGPLVRGPKGGTEKSEQSRAITGLSPSMASYSKLLFVPLLDRSLPLQSVPKKRDLVRLSGARGRVQRTL